MGELRKDAKDLLLGNDGSDKEPDDFDSELKKAERANLITESDGKILIGARANADKAWNNMNKSQADAVLKIKDYELYETAEEELKAEKKKKEKKAEQERKRKERESQQAIKMQKDVKSKEKTEGLDKQKQKEREEN